MRWPAPTYSGASAITSLKVAYLILAAQQHDALQTFCGVMMSFVVPLTLVTVVAVMIRRPAAAGEP